MSTDTPEEARQIVQAITVEVAKLTLGPKDTLVLKMNTTLSRLQRERVRRIITDNIPTRGANCIVLDAGMDLQVVQVQPPEGG